MKFKTKFNWFNLFLKFFCLIQITKCDLMSDLQNSGKFNEGFIKPLADYVSNNPELSHTQCFNDILLWQKNISSFWALQMLDANGKLPAGILTGNFHTLGQYDECLSVEAKENDRVRFKGKYCFALLPLMAFQTMIKSPFTNRAANVDEFGRLTYNWAVCLPASCKAEEIQKLIRDTLASLGIDTPRTITVPEKFCKESKPVELSGAVIALITLSSIFGTLMILSTGYDIFCQMKDERSGRCHDVLISFSIYTNTKKLMKINRNSSTLRCIHGVRVLSLLWVILGHRYTTALVFPRLNSLDLIDWLKSYSSTLITSGTVSVDTFFVLSGLLLAYVFFKQNHNRTSFNPLMFYVHRLVRIWPAMAAVVFAHAALFEYLSDGPYWPVINDVFIEPCKQYWWSAILYVQNYVNPDLICVGQLWYLSIDMQLYILSPILIYPFLKDKKIGWANLIFWILLSQAATATIAYVYKLPSIVLNAADNDYMVKYYLPTHTRATPWLLGFAGGYILYKTSSRNIKINKVVVIILWLASLAIMAAVVFGMKPLQQLSHTPNLQEDGTYNAFSRTGWTLAVIWLIFACVHGYGGPINWILSFRFWEVLGRFSYSMYLLHFIIMYWKTASTRTTLEFSHLYMIYDFFGDVVMTLMLSYVWVLAFESPFLALEKAILTKAKSPNKTEEKSAVETKNTKNYY